MSSRGTALTTLLPCNLFYMWQVVKIFCGLGVSSNKWNCFAPVWCSRRTTTPQIRFHISDKQLILRSGETLLRLARSFHNWKTRVRANHHMFVLCWTTAREFSLFHSHTLFIGPTMPRTPKAPPSKSNYHQCGSGSPSTGPGWCTHFTVVWSKH